MKIELIKRLSHPTFKLVVQADKSKGYCRACGQMSYYDFEQFINDDLARLWKISDKERHAFSSRESRQCKSCGSNHRNRQFSKVLCDEYATTSKIWNLKSLIHDSLFRNLRIAEINACGHLHQFLAEHPKLLYSEFGSKDPTIHSEDIQALTYKDNSIDLVLTSDTLEHIPDYKLALNEIHRVLKHSGKHIFTIPVIWQRTTKRRAELTNNKKIIYKVEPAYHGPAEEANLVWTDFGYDVLKEIDTLGFETKVLQYNIINPHDASCVLVSTKKEK